MNDRILDNIERIRTFSLVLAIFLFVVAAYLRLSGMGPVMGRMFPAFKALMVFAWVFAVLGYAKRYLNRQGRFYKYLNNASFPFYIFHYVPITVAAYFIARSDLNVWLKWVVIIVLAYPSTFALYEIVKRIPVLRFLFGVKPGRQGFS